jgi:hypothetical protein
LPSFIREPFALDQVGHVGCHLAIRADVTYDQKRNMPRVLRSDSFELPKVPGASASI